MRIYSAGEAIGPAWEHTKALLFHDRRFGRLLKICLVAFGAHLGGGLSGNYRGSGAGHSMPALLPLLVIFAVLGFAFGIALFYLGSRLQFVLFDVVLLRDDRIAPAWRRHGGHTWRWIGVKLAATAALLLLFSPLLLPLIVPLVHLFRSPAFQGATASSHFEPSAFRAALFLILELLGVLMLFVALFRLFTTLALPGLALEDLRFVAVFERAWLLFRSDPPAMLLYLVVQPLLLVSLGLLGLLCWLLAVATPAVPVAFLLFRLWHGTHAGVGSMFLMGTVGGVGAIALVAWGLLTYLLFSGTLLTFAQAYSLYFIGGRYPRLGQYLAPASTLETAPQLGFRE